MTKPLLILTAAALAACARQQPICTSSESSRRPPEWYTEAVKHVLALEEGRSVSCCELDHIVPLELGGAAWSWSNLQLQPWAAARRKDRAENGLHRLVCRGQMPLAQARQIMLRWKD